MTAISGDLAYYSNGYYYTTDGTAIPESSLQIQGQEISYLSQQAPTDSFEISAANETCTDGKDDGKIGFFGAIGNALKGVGKTIVNGVKGMFTDSEGNFSLGKTLLSIGTAALCIAVPAVGVAACAVGAVAGGVQVAKGAIAASQATTDAEAKAAWQNIGGGAFTAVASAAGAKAGVKGMTTGATKVNGSSALNTLKGNGTKLSLKTAGEYGKAFVHDGFYSGKYNLSQARSSIATKAGNAFEAAKHPIQTAKKSNLADKIKNSIDDHKTINEAKAANKANHNQTVSTAENASSPQSELYTLADDTKLTKTQQRQRGQSQIDKFNERMKKADPNHTTTSTTKAGQAAQESQKATITQTQEGIASESAKTTIKQRIGNLRQKVQELPKSTRDALGKKGTEIWEALNKQQDASTLINKYGYDTILEVLKVVEGYAVSNEAV